jgi:hypothetical protein
VLAVADVAALLRPDAMSAALFSLGLARVTLCPRRDIWCLVDSDDLSWITAHGWNAGWHAKTRWKLYAKRNVGAARSTVYLHREVLLRADAVDADFASRHHAHHLNGQSLDNRRANLGWRTPSVNAALKVKREAVPSLQAIVAELARNAGARLAGAANGYALADTF